MPEIVSILKFNGDIGHILRPDIIGLISAASFSLRFHRHFKRQIAERSGTFYLQI
jgi:hypothetical protein